MARSHITTKIIALASIGFLYSQLASADTTVLKIGLAVANLRADFFNQIKTSVEKAGHDAGIDIVTVDAQGDSATQISQIQDLIAQKISALIYIPAGATADSVPIKLAKAAGIPTVAVDRNPVGVPADTFIASDSVAGARTLGEWVVKQTGGKGKVAIIQGQPGTTPELDRDKGFNEALAAYPGLVVVAKQPSEAWHQDEGFAIAQNMLQQNPEITVFFGRADALALGAAQAVHAADLSHKVIVVGFDGDVEGLKAVDSGKLDATMTQQTQLMGRLALRSALDLIAHKPVPPIQLQQATLTTKQNVGPFIEKHP